MSLNRITLVFEDSRSVEVGALAHETVYSAALRQKVRLEHDCLEGACASCKALCTSGEYALGDVSEDALSKAEAAQRQVLACQMRATSDCVLEFGYDSALALGKQAPVELAAALVSAERVSSTVVRLELALQGPAPAFLAGQYVHLSVPGTDVRRSYSFANPPGEGARMLFYVKQLASGAMSDYVGRAAPGDAFTLTGPYGRFYLRAPQRPILMVAGGTGLAPMLSMLEQLAAQGCTQPIHLLYGVAEPQEYFGAAQLDGLAARGLSLSVERISVADDGGKPAGHVTSLLRAGLVHAGEVDAYLCGPPPMVEAATGWLLGAGVPQARIHAEKFLPS